MHAYVLNAGGAAHIFDLLSGNGLGLVANALLSTSPALRFNRMTGLFYTQRFASAWELALNDASPASLEATRRRPTNLTNDNVNAVLLQAAEGKGALIVLRPDLLSNATEEPAPAPPSTSEERVAEPQAELMPEAHLVQASAYSIPPEPKEEELPPQSIEPDILSSLPRLHPLELTPTTNNKNNEERTSYNCPCADRKNFRPAVFAEAPGGKNDCRRNAIWRRGSERMGQGLQSFLPLLLPGSDTSATYTLPSYMMAFIAVLVPLIVVTIASVVYFRYGRSVQYEEYLVQARNAQTIAIGLTDPVSQREHGNKNYRISTTRKFFSQTSDTQTMRGASAIQAGPVGGISRCNSSRWAPESTWRSAAWPPTRTIFTCWMRCAAMYCTSQSAPTDFRQTILSSCGPDTYGNYTVGPLVDILTRLRSIP